MESSGSHPQLGHETEKHVQDPAQQNLGQRNRDHFDNVASTVFDVPWVQKLAAQITDELRKEADWIGCGNSQSAAKTPRKLLDYACGNGVASRALVPYMSTIRGVDISSKMVEQYNKFSIESSFAYERMHAVEGDFVFGADQNEVLVGPDFVDFDFAIISMALHHVQDPGHMIAILSQRLKSGGVLLVVDWVDSSESGCTPIQAPDGPVSGTVSRMGFVKSELHEWCTKAGMKKFEWKWFSSRSTLPSQMGGEKQLFLAKATKP